MTATAISVDREKCTACGACIAECPAHIFALDDGKPSVISEERCILCGHCVAVCPVEAVTHSGLPGPCPAINPSLQVDAQAVMQLLRSRRSVRAYTDEPVADEHLAMLIEAGRYAPSASNRQPCEFLVIRGRDKLARISDAMVAYMESVLHDLADRERREALAAATSEKAVEAMRNMAPMFRNITRAQRAGRDMIFRGAPDLIVIHTRAGSGASDVHYAAANIGLMAHALGLGVCLIGFLVGPARASREVAAAVGIPEGNDIGIALVVGHPKYPYPRIAPRRETPVTWV